MNTSTEHPCKDHNHGHSHEHTHDSPCSGKKDANGIDFEWKSPCSEPCSDPCSDREPCSDQMGDAFETPFTGFSAMFHTAFRNAFKIAFDEILEEPKRILMIGGCRQREFARYLGFLLPVAEIYVLDYDKEEVVRAKEEVCCRFQFVHSTVEKMPFENDFFDLTIGHHIFEYVTDWEASMSEIARVTTANLLLTQPRPRLWGWANRLPGVAASFKKQGLSMPERPVSRNDLFTHLNRYAKIKAQLAPMPWEMFMTAMKPGRVHRTLLVEETVPV